LHELPAEYLGSVAFSRDGKTLAVAPGDATVHLYDAKTGKELPESARRMVRSQRLAYSPDGKLLVVAALELHLLDATTGEVVRTLAGSKDFEYGAAFTPDSKRVAAGGREGIVRIFDVATGKEIGRLEGREGRLPEGRAWITCLAFSSDGKRLAGASRGGLIHLWDPAKSEEVAQIAGHLGIVWSAAFAPDGKTLASGGQDGTVRIWNLANNA